jgi:hypothetical protein
MSETPLRKDARQWLIYDDASIEAGVRSLEMVSLGIVGANYQNHPDQAMRGISNAMLKLSKARLEAGYGLIKGVETSDELLEATRCAFRVFEYLGDKTGEIPYPVAEADQLYALLFYLDSRLNGAGISGPGIKRKLARGDF